MSARPMNTAHEHDFELPDNPLRTAVAGAFLFGQHDDDFPPPVVRPSVASLLARAERAILAREKALARFKAACALSLMGLDFVLLKGLRERRVDRCARLVRESYAEIAALVQAWQELYEKVSGGSR